AKSSFRDRQVQGQIVFHSDRGVNDPAVQRAMESLFNDVQHEVANVTVVSPYSTDGQRQIGRDDPNVAYAEVNFADRSNEQFRDDGERIKELGEQIHVPGLEIEYGGDMFATDPINGATEAIGIMAAMIILLIAFGSVLAMGLPIGTALFGIGTGVAIVLILRSVIDMPDFTTAAVAMVGIGVGIDYALFIVTRYRENLAAGLDPERSVVHSIDTAGRAVLFAGSTVVISVLGLWLMSAALNDPRGVACSTQPQTNPDGTVAIMQVFPTSDPQAKATADLVGRLRDRVIPSVVHNEVDVKVGGITAAADDFAAYTADRLPLFIGAVLLLSFLLLMLVCRSLLVPLQAVIMNLLS